MNLPRRALAEFLGSAFLLTAVIGSGIMATKLGGNGALALLCNALPTGAILAVLILIFGPVSGAHFNPVVTLAFVLRRELSANVALVYLAAQLAGAIVGAFVATFLGQALGWYGPNEGAGLIGAAVGAIVVLAVWGFFAKRA